MLRDVRETFRTVNIFVNKKNACFYIFGLVVTLVILLASKGGGGFPSESQSLLQRYTITIFTARLLYQVSDACYEAVNNKSNSLPIS